MTANDREVLFPSGSGSDSGSDSDSDSDSGSDWATAIGRGLPGSGSGSDSDSDSGGEVGWVIPMVEGIARTRESAFLNASRTALLP